MKIKLFFVALLIFSTMFADQECNQAGCSQETLVNALCAYKKIKDSALGFSEEVKRGIQCLQVGCMLIDHPVAKLCGAVLELASVGVDVYEMFQDAFLPEEAAQKNVYRDFCLPERFYFEMMYKKLNDLKKDFLEIKNIVCDVYDVELYEKSYDFFKVTVAQEVAYNETQKRVLRYIRQKELHGLENEIESIQYQIAWHFSELVDARLKSLAYAKKVFAYVSDARSLLQNSSENTTKEQLIDLYSKEMYLKKIVDEYLSYTAKVIVLINFFKQSSHAQVLKQTSNIMQIINQLESEMKKEDFIECLKHS